MFSLIVVEGHCGSGAVVFLASNHEGGHQHSLMSGSGVDTGGPPGT